MSKRRLLCRLAALMLALFLLPVAGAKADLMSEARGMLKMINDFRTGGNAWYWNSDNTTRTVKTGLGRLQYDTELEAVALVRAKEIAVRFDHTRPDGTDCFTAFPSGRSFMAENIAYGYPTARLAFEGFLEENDDYAGQGHRRIMLSSQATRVGIAAVEIGGVRYWVQEFASAPSASSPSGGKAGWEERGGKWYYRKADGSLVTGWLKSGGKWYYLNKDGVMQTGWIRDGGNRYFLNASGAMQTGWVQNKGKWYFLNASGAMQTGWIRDSGKWYYLNKDGIMQTGWVNDGGARYYMDSSGAMATGWKKISGKWYYFKASGAMHTGWLKEGSKWYYLRSSGEMVTGTVTIDGSREVFGSDGAWRYTQLQEYDTPLGTEDTMVRMIKSLVQYIRMAFRTR